MKTKLFSALFLLFGLNSCTKSDKLLIPTNTVFKTSSPVNQVYGMNNSNFQYCSSGGNPNSDLTRIKRVWLGSINNTTSNNTGYNDYTNLVAHLLPGVQDSIELTPSDTDSTRIKYWKVFIDFNYDGIFGEGERVFAGSSTGIILNKFTTPNVDTAITTRMRIQMKVGSPTSGPCDNFYHGEVEDYSVKFNPPDSI